MEWGNEQSGVLRGGNWGAHSGWNWELRVERSTKWRVGLKGMVLRACELSGEGDLEGRGH